MILIDSRTGSKEFFTRIRKPRKLVRLSFADFMFVGNGPTGPVAVGLERKTVGDLRDSFITGRLSGHQLPGLLDSYNVTYLIIEGKMKEDRRTGALMVWGRRNKRGAWTQDLASQVSYGSIMGFLTTIENYCGIRVRFTENMSQTAQLVMDLNKWWAKGWADHKSLCMFNTASEYHVGMKRPSLLRKIAADLPGIGWKRSEAVEDEFNSIQEMMNADEDHWAFIPGIGKGIARSVTRAIRKGEM